MGGTQWLEVVASPILKEVLIWARVSVMWS